jgi:hypothetical protein
VECVCSQVACLRLKFDNVFAFDCFVSLTWLLTGLLLVCRWGTGDWDASWILLAAVVNCLPCWCSEALIFPTKEVCISHKGLEIGFKYVCLLNLEFLERWQCNPSYASGLYAFSWGDIVVVKHWEVSMISQFVQLYWCLMSAASCSLGPGVFLWTNCSVVLWSVTALIQHRCLVHLKTSRVTKTYYCFPCFSWSCIVC